MFELVMDKASNLDNLQKRSDIISLLIVTINIIFVLAPLFIGASIEPGPIYLGLSLWFGVAMSSLLNLMHEAAHFHVFKGRHHSRLLGRYILSPLVVSNFDAYRKRHWLHHKHLGQAQDTKYTYLMNLSGVGLMMFFLRLLFLIEALKKFTYINRADNEQQNINKEYSVSPLLPILAIHLVLFVGLFLTVRVSHSVTYIDSVFILLWVYLVIYVYGLGAITMLVNALRSVAEHRIFYQDKPEASSDAALRNLKCTSLSRILFGAYGFGEHATHHAYPSIPYYHLGALTARCAQQDAMFQPSYGYFEICWKLIKKE